MKDQTFDIIVIGAGVSGPIIAHHAVSQGKSCLILEAGKFFYTQTFPRNEIDANSQLYWGGGIELNHNASLAVLRPKVVGGGSIVNQALLDRFDDMALEDFTKDSGVSFFNSDLMKPWYDKSEAGLSVQKISPEYQNQNARIFSEGLASLGYKFSPLTRAQKNCQSIAGNDCINCLSGCSINSKQSSLVTYLRKAFALGLKIYSEFEVSHIKTGEFIQIFGTNKKGEHLTFKAKKLVLASGAIGNSKILLNSGLKNKIPALGEFLYTHPQYMILAEFNKEIHSHEGPLQTYKSDEPYFRKNGFKLENVFAPPVAISMLLPSIGSSFMKSMNNISKMASIEVAIRDTEPGAIRAKANKQFVIYKKLNQEDLKRKKMGFEIIHKIFHAQNAQKITEGSLGIALHLMGGCRIGTEYNKSVVTPDFNLQGHQNIFIADSSIFPNAPGINPSFTIMALSHMACSRIIP